MARVVKGRMQKHTENRTLQDGCREGDMQMTEKTGLTLSPSLVSVLAITLILTLFIGLYPDPFITMAQTATQGF